MNSVNDITRRQLEESTFATHDGQQLFYRYWSAHGERQGAIVLFHRGHEHGARMAHLVDELNMPGFDFFAWDARGNGHSPGERGYSPSMSHSVRDVQSFVDHICSTYNIRVEDVSVIAQSVGAVIVSTWLNDYAPRIRAAVLASPAFKVKLYVPFARFWLRIMRKIRGHFYVNSYVKAKFLTHDQARIESFDRDPLIARPISVDILLQLHETADRVLKNAHAIVTPVQLLISGSDWVVHHGPQHEFFTRLGSHIKEKHVLNGFYHDTLGEEDRHIAVQQVRKFLMERYAAPLNLPNLTTQHEHGVSRYESDKLAAPLPRFSLRGIYWSLARFGIKIGGLLSKGVTIGQKTGFDSGTTLDYVYKNKPTGRLIIGKLIDKSYLNAVGWRGIRIRKTHIEELLNEALKKLREKGMNTNIVDIAAGHGRYLLETISQMSEKPNSVLLRDYSDINVRDGGGLISKFGLNDIATFIKADAFDQANLAELAHSPNRPTISVVSGLYELFPNNEMLERSLAGLAQAVEKDGYLIYTNQPWHPQLEYIARALTSHRAGQAWVMRCRSQAEMDQLVRAAGFEKIAERIDPFGIFTVSLARRNG